MKQDLGVPVMESMPLKAKNAKNGSVYGTEKIAGAGERTYSRLVVLASDLKLNIFNVSLADMLGQYA